MTDWLRNHNKLINKQINLSSKIEKINWLWSALFPTYVLPFHCMKSLQVQSFFWSIFFCIRSRNNSVFARSSRSDSFEILWMNYAFSNSFSLKYASVRIISVTWELKTPHVFSLLYNSKHHSWLFCFVQSFTSNKLHNSFFFISKEWQRHRSLEMTLVANENFVKTNIILIFFSLANLTVFIL